MGNTAISKLLESFTSEIPSAGTWWRLLWRPWLLPLYVVLMLVVAPAFMRGSQEDAAMTSIFSEQVSALLEHPFAQLAYVLLAFWGIFIAARSIKKEDEQRAALVEGARKEALAEVESKMDFLTLFAVRSTRQEALARMEGSLNWQRQSRSKLGQTEFLEGAASAEAKYLTSICSLASQLKNCGTDAGWESVVIPDDQPSEPAICKERADTLKVRALSFASNDIQKSTENIAALKQELSEIDLKISRLAHDL